MCKRLTSIQKILERMERESKSFGEVVLSSDMDERQVTREDSLAKVLAVWQAMCDASDAYTGERRSVILVFRLAY